MDEPKPTPNSDDSATEFKPDDTISPRLTQVSAPTVTEPQPIGNPPVTSPVIQQPATEPSSSYAIEQPVSTGDWTNDAPANEEITWTASEFIAHNKSATWYLILGVVVLVAAILTFILTHDFIATTVIVIAGIALGVYGARQPRQLRYQLNPAGLTIADKFFSFNIFRSFAVLDEGGFSSIVFMPLQRFGQLITIYFDPADEERIVDLLASQLPLENKSHDIIDQLMRRIRF